MHFTTVIITMVIIYIATSNNQILAAPIPDGKPPAPESQSLLSSEATKLNLAALLSKGAGGDGSRTIGNLNIGL